MVVDTRFTGDVALGKPAMQSSTFGPQYAAALATDGRSTNFTHTAIEDTHPWLQVDLEQPHEIDAIIVHNRDDCCGSRLRNIVVDILASDGQTVVFTSTILNENNARKNPQWLAVGLPEATGDKVRGRYVRIRRQAEPGASGTIAQLGDWRVLSVGEVQIFADPVLKITPLEDGAEAASDAEAARNEQ
jgi:hypothetical protein